MWQYSAVLAFCALCGLLLDRFLSAGILQQWRRFVSALWLPAFAFIVIDLIAHHQGLWSYAQEFTFAPRLLGFPIEEYAFFFIIPFIGLATLEVVRKKMSR